MAATTLSGTVAIIGTVTSINISSIVFKQGNTTVHTISANLPSVNASDNTSNKKIKKICSQHLSKN
jgi:hypothetical protein